MLKNLPNNTYDFMDWKWPQIEPYYRKLSEQVLDISNLNEWMREWSRLGELMLERENRLYIATTIDTTDQQAEKHFQSFLDDIYPQSKAADQNLKEILLKSGLCPENFEVPLRNMRAEVEIFNKDNLPLLARELKLITEYDKIIGSQTIIWEGKEITLPQLTPVYQQPERQTREHAWRMAAERQLKDRDAINQHWKKFLNVRTRIADNAGLPDYRTYRWMQLLRFDYQPENCFQFHQAIKDVAVPAAERIYMRRQERLGLDKLRPWDLQVDPYKLPALHPFKDTAKLERGVSAIFHQVDPQLGANFDTMRQEGLLDLENRKGKAPGGYCEILPVIRSPFIFMNAVGIHDDVQTLIHEGGHAFHVFESASLPYLQQLNVGLEFAEVASMGMELLASPFLSENYGGFYSESDAARARILHLEDAVCFWPYMAVVDSFQHWVYENPALAIEPDKCDACWAELWQQYMPGVDWGGLEEEMVTGWHRKLHIHGDPFYYIEYGLAQLGAFQVWKNALEDQKQAVADYRKALSLGATVTLPELFRTAGANFAFDLNTLQEAVDLAERSIAQLESEIHP